ncbi:MAG: TetM/TetW/TetO/TetS family tetracycline resistance ribosomal protection protein [Clostridia bacterium]|nr:TetM/TetW/TetO/TetS family tetracycline resistance ribosomal protection protein [Clostridia bacterium]
MESNPKKRSYCTALLAHVDAGKTTLTEQMLYLCGSIKQAGSVDRGTAHSDSMDIERRRGISVRAACVSMLWNDSKINLIDTPGHVDFAADVERAMRVLDCAILVVSAAEGVQPRTELLWKAMQSAGIPVMIFINKADRIGADIERTLDQLKKKLAYDMVLINRYSDADVYPLSPDELLEQLADKDEELMEKYLEGRGAEVSKLKSTLKRLTLSRQAYPVLCGSALKGVGVRELLDAVTDYFPESRSDENSDFSALVYKIEHSKQLGRLAHVRIWAGSIKNRDAILNNRTGESEKVTRLMKPMGAQMIEDKSAGAGDIAVLCGLPNAKIGDIYGDISAVPEQTEPTKPLLRVRIAPKDDSQIPAIVEALSELTDEDPMLGLEWERELRQIYINITGLIQLEVIDELLKTRFNITVDFEPPTVIYKETPISDGYGFVAYTMPKPCWAVMKLHFEPLERGAGVVFESVVNDNLILPRYQNHVEQGLPTALRQGPLGWEVTDVKITLVDGSSHQFHTHPLDFIVATPMAVMDGLTRIGTTLLEPIMAFELICEESQSAAVIGQVLAMRGQLENSCVNDEGKMVITGFVPLATSVDFPVWVASATSGKGVLSMRFHKYEPCPLELGKTTEYRGVHPLDTAKYILYIRGALGDLRPN